MRELVLFLGDCLSYHSFQFRSCQKSGPLLLRHHPFHPLLRNLRNVTDFAGRLQTPAIIISPKRCSNPNNVPYFLGRDGVSESDPRHPSGDSRPPGKKKKKTRRSMYRRERSLRLGTRCEPIGPVPIRTPRAARWISGSR